MNLPYGADQLASVRTLSNIILSCLESQMTQIDSNNFPSQVELIKWVVGVTINTRFWLSWQSFNCLLPSIASSVFSHEQKPSKKRCGCKCSSCLRRR